MRLAADRRADRNRGARLVIEEKIKTKVEGEHFKLVGARTANVEKVRENYAASRIQGLIRGFLARLRVADLLIYWRAAITIQRVMRGKLGRIRWNKLYWLTRSVAKSDTALKDLVLRSSLIRRDYKKGMNGWDWQERFDPLTNSIWYYNKKNGRNTWDCPAIFQKLLMCTWTGYPGFKSRTSVGIAQYNPLHPDGERRKQQQERVAAAAAANSALASGDGSTVSGGSLLDDEYGDDELEEGNDDRNDGHIPHKGTRRTGAGRHANSGAMSPLEDGSSVNSMSSGRQFLTSNSNTKYLQKRGLLNLLDSDSQSATMKSVSSSMSLTESEIEQERQRQQTAGVNTMSSLDTWGNRVVPPGTANQEKRIVWVLDRTTGKKKKMEIKTLVEEIDQTQACRCTFKTAAELHYHLHWAHRWYCPACEFRNSGLNFPMCTLCGNTLSDSGIDGVETMKKHAAVLHAKIDSFLKADGVRPSDERCSIKDRLTELTKKRRKAFDDLCSLNEEEEDEYLDGGGLVIGETENVQWKHEKQEGKEGEEGGSIQAFDSTYESLKTNSMFDGSQNQGYGYGHGYIQGQNYEENLIGSNSSQIQTQTRIDDPTGKHLLKQFKETVKSLHYNKAFRHHHHHHHQLEHNDNGNIGGGHEYTMNTTFSTGAGTGTGVGTGTGTGAGMGAGTIGNTGFTGDVRNKTNRYGGTSSLPLIGGLATHNNSNRAAAISSSSEIQTQTQGHQRNNTNNNNYISALPPAPPGSYAVVKYREGVDSGTNTMMPHTEADGSNIRNSGNSGGMSPNTNTNINSNKNTHNMTSLFGNKKGLKSLRVMYQGHILGKGKVGPLQQAEKDKEKKRKLALRVQEEEQFRYGPSRPVKSHPMQKTLPEFDTSKSDTQWEVTEAAPLLDDAYLPTDPEFFNRKLVGDSASTVSSSAAASATSSVKSSSLPMKTKSNIGTKVKRGAADEDDDSEDDDLRNGNGDGNEGGENYLEDMPVPYTTVKTISDARNFVERGGKRAEKPPIISPVDAGVLFEEELIDVLEGFEDEARDIEKLRLKKKMLSDPKYGKKRQEEPTNAYGTYNISWQDNEDRMRLLVCSKFIAGKCSLTTCPLAHPGIRDSALITYSKPPGEKKKIPLVRVCGDYDAFHNACEKGMDCKHYHVYVRPSTKEIIQRMYPITAGPKTKQFKSGARIDGIIKDGDFNGYAIMTWPTKSTYLGDFERGIRHGLGISWSPTGLEYVGGWSYGKRHGLGVMTTANGDEYAGEWVEGKMEGMGRLTCANGDVYEGEFKNSKYHGLGVFRKKSGDVYMGYCVDGMATGLGVLSLNSGEKYKGFFDRNFRHGKGVCIYRNKSRYAGEWYRGYPDGFGIYTAPPGVGGKYIGEWSVGRKHGNGRYYFPNGDFYDGEFKKNRAEGQGVYYHTNGNIYKGLWKDDKRNGFGTYIFVNGSKFTGTFVDNDIDGKGKFDYACGSHYRGEFKKNIKHGRGIFTWPNLTEYKGQFVEDRICGMGEIKYASGHRYIGHWKNNKKNGFGKFMYQKGHIYEGEFKDDIRHGKGKMTFYPGSGREESYEGDWDHDEIHGQGTYVFPVRDGGVVYQGDWVRGVRHGKGLLTFKDGSFYRGDFVREQMNGKGVYVSKDGAQYEGDWRNNMRHGTGTSIDPDGTIYHGEFRHNMKHGSGIQHDIDGGEFKGTWEGNIRIGYGTYRMEVGKGILGGPEKIAVRVIAL